MTLPILILTSLKFSNKIIEVLNLLFKNLLENFEADILSTLKGSMVSIILEVASLRISVFPLHASLHAICLRDATLC